MPVGQGAGSVGRPGLPMSEGAIPRLGPRGLVAIFLLGFGVRTAATAFVGFSTLGFGDARAYLLAAVTLAETGSYPKNTDSFFFRPPGYPAFLVLATLGNPHRIALAKVANVFLGALSPLLLAALSARLFRRRNVAIVTGFVAAIHPSFVLVATEVQSEPLFLVLFLLAGFLLLTASDRPSSTQAVAAGMSLGLGALTRATALALVPFLLAPLFDRRYPLRARWHLAAPAVLGFFLILAPWTLRNALVFHELIPVNDGAGFTFFHGNSVWTRRYYEIRTRKEYDRWSQDFIHDMRARLARLEKDGELLPGDRSARFMRMAIDEGLADPRGSIRLFGLKAWQWLRPYPTPWFWPTPIVIGIGVLYFGLDVFAAIGLALAPRRGVALFCLALLAVTMAIHVAMLVIWRYRVPYWDPVLLLFAVYGGFRVASRWAWSEARLPAVASPA